MNEPIRVMVEKGKKKRSVAIAFDWPGWDRSAKTVDGAVENLAAYRRRYAKVAELAGLGDEFRASGDVDVVEVLEGTGMTDFYGVSGRSATSEVGPMSEAELERKIALLRASWAYFDDVGSRVSAELRPGPRGGGRDRDRIIRHTNGAEIFEFAKKVGMNVPLETRESPDELRAYREQLVAAIRDHNARGVPARSWSVQYLIRHSAFHMLDHAWEMEDRDLTGES